MALMYALLYRILETKSTVYLRFDMLSLFTENLSPGTKNDISSYLGIFMRYLAAVCIKDKYLGLISKSINDVRIFLENILKYLCTVGMRRYIRMVFFRQVVVLMPESIDVRMCLW